MTQLPFFFHFSPIISSVFSIFFPVYLSTYILSSVLRNSLLLFTCISLNLMTWYIRTWIKVSQTVKATWIFLINILISHTCWLNSAERYQSKSLLGDFCYAQFWFTLADHKAVIAGGKHTPGHPNPVTLWNFSLWTVSGIPLLHSQFHSSETLSH